VQNNIFSQEQELRFPFNYRFRSLLDTFSLLTLITYEHSHPEEREEYREGEEEVALLQRVDPHLD
jgi:hypothetical protein